MMNEDEQRITLKVSPRDVSTMMVAFAAYRDLIARHGPTIRGQLAIEAHRTGNPIPATNDDEVGELVVRLCLQAEAQR